jgi:biotin carboxylase
MRSSLTFYTWGGGGNAGAIVNDPEIESISRRIIQSVGGWQGPINLEFRRHVQSGKPYLIEANCRLNGYSYLTTMNGMNYPRAMLDLLVGSPATKTALRPTGPSHNFVLGFREKIVARWAGE